MQSGVTMKPVSARTHAKKGTCTLCGQHARLTEAHVPPRAAFNNGPMRRAMVTATEHLEMDRQRNGGLRIPAHCDTCRATTSPWDDEYIHWAKHFSAALQGLNGQPGDAMRTDVPDARPGRFIRAALAGLSALAEGLQASHPELIDSIMAGAGANGARDLRFLMAVTNSADSAQVTGMHQGAMVPISLTGDAESASLPTASAVIHFYPFSLVLANESVADSFPHVDCTGWLDHGVDDAGNDLTLRLPLVQLVGGYPLIPSAFGLTTF